MRPIASFDARSFPTRVAAEVPIGALTAEWLASHAGAKAESVARALASGTLRDRKVGFALLAGAEAWRHAGCGDGERDAWLVLALGLEHAALEDFAPILRGDAIDWSLEPAAALPHVRFRAPVDSASSALRSLLGLRGPSVQNVSACAAGALALAHAAALVQRGTTDIVVCGASDSMINPLGIGGMSRLGAPSPRASADACKPFDRTRDGLVIGEGAAVFIVESAARASARGARALARIAGWGSTQDAFRVTAPRPDGSAAALAMQKALQRAHLQPHDLGYINAHGTGTPLNDPAEARALHRALGESVARSVPISSIKGAIGHLMAASGAIELAACLLAIEYDTLPGTAHLSELDADCDLAVIGPTPRAARVDRVMSNSFGFGGQNCSVVLERVP